MSKKAKYLYRLEENEKKLLGFELSRENVPYLLMELKHYFNETYQLIMNIFKKIFSAKKNNNLLYRDLDKYIQELEKAEMNVLKFYKLMMFYLKIKNLDINQTDIIIEFENEEEKNNLLALLSERKPLLDKFKENIKKLENLKRNVNFIYEQMMSLNDIDNNE